ncbi:MAG TPA: hypothetical protein VK612_11795, partial [Pyrinomonadaceae bacterium]|nr:hypothetical protein [Pyrinomonadaceae bacterium]
MMTAELAKETNFGAAFREFIANREEPDALRKLRAEAFGVFADKGFPTPRLEDWKYTNVAAVGGGKWIVDNVRNPEDEIETAILGKFNFERNGFTALNLAFADVAVFRIAKETVVDEPIEFSFVGEDGKAI